jgi:nucleolar GTP-binding protein
MERDSIKKLRQDGRRGEADRHFYDPKPKHLFSGKMGFQRDRR